MTIPAKEWCEEYDKLFPMPPEWSPTPLEPIYDLEVRKNDIKSFIQTLLDQHSAHLVARIESLKKKPDRGITMESDQRKRNIILENNLRNQILDQAIDIIKSN